PTLKTNAVTGITSVSSISGGNAVSNGGAPITDRGVCISLNPSPTIDDIKIGTSTVSGSGDFQSDITGLKSSTTYYLRAFATNKSGTGYGNEISFKTADAIQAKKPIVLLDSTSFSSQEKFDSKWNMFYPWG